MWLVTRIAVWMVAIMVVVMVVIVTTNVPMVAATVIAIVIMVVAMIVVIMAVVAAWLNNLCILQNGTAWLNRLICHTSHIVHIARCAFIGVCLCAMIVAVAILIHMAGVCMCRGSCSLVVARRSCTLIANLCASRYRNHYAEYQCY